jgi:hypothetical protein
MTLGLSPAGNSTASTTTPTQTSLVAARAGDGPQGVTFGELLHLRARPADQTEHRGEPGEIRPVPR